MGEEAEDDLYRAEVYDDFDDEDDGDGYCQCGAHHDEDELDGNRCACCGLPIDINDEPV